MPRTKRVVTVASSSIYARAELKQAEAARLGYKDGLMRDNVQFKKNVREVMAQSLGELRGGQLAIERGMDFHL